MSSPESLNEVNLAAVATLEGSIDLRERAVPIAIELGAPGGRN